MLNTLNKIVLVVLALLVVWLVATIGFMIFRVAMTLIIGLLTVGVLVGIGALIYNYMKNYFFIFFRRKDGFSF